MRLEVLTMSLHFGVSLAILAAYLYTVIIGTPDETLKNLLLLAGGYWFGVGGGMALKKVAEAKEEKGGGS